jgi:hypothetical protein
MGGPGRTKIYDLAKRGELKLIDVAGRTIVDGASLRALLGVAAWITKPPRRPEGGCFVILVADTTKILEMRGTFKVRGVSGIREMNNRSAYCAGQSDPSENRQFRRRWAERDGANSATVSIREQNPVVPRPVTEGAMRTYVETIAMIVGLLAAYFALLPLTIWSTTYPANPGKCTRMVRNLAIYARTVCR